MTLDEFIGLQDQIWWGFGWLVRWWLILFAVGGTALGALMFFLSVISTWLDSR